MTKIAPPTDTPMTHPACVSGVGFRVQNVRFRGLGLRFGDRDARFRVSVSGFGDEALRVRFCGSGLGFRI